MFAKCVKDEYGENIIVLEATHCNYAIVKGVEVGECVTERFFVGKFNLETFEKKVELHESSLLFMDRMEFFEHEVGVSYFLYEVEVGWGDMRLDEPLKGTIVMLPDKVSLR